MLIEDYVLERDAISARTCEGMHILEIFYFSNILDGFGEIRGLEVG
jgi:hypothetical protein